MRRGAGSQVYLCQTAQGGWKFAADEMCVECLARIRSTNSGGRWKLRRARSHEYMGHGRVQATARKGRGCRNLRQRRRQ